jgi:nucleoside-diphosphate-sugar epimerase
MRVLLLGATGFVGNHVLDLLSTRGGSVRCLVRPESLEDPQKRRVVSREGVDVVPGSVMDLNSMLRACNGVDVIYHLAATLPGQGSPRQMFEVNTGGTRTVLQAAQEMGVSRLVFVSSAGLYGEASFEVSENTRLTPRGPYAQSKVAGERLVLASDDHDVDGVILRLSHAYGSTSPFFRRLIAQIVLAPRSYMARPGPRTMQWIHVEDVADAVIRAGAAPGAAGEVFNIAGSVAFTRSQIAALAHEAAFGSQAGAVDAALPQIPLRYSIKKAQHVLGFSPNIPLPRGLAELVQEVMSRFELPGRMTRAVRRRRIDASVPLA